MSRFTPFSLCLSLVFVLAGCQAPKENYQISVTFGKAYAYSPHSNEILDWTGSLDIRDGALDSLFKLTYGTTNWEKGYGGCSREYSKKLDKTEWITDIRPGSGRGLEGIRFFLKGDSSTIITINTKAGKAEFKLGDLLKSEYLEFPFGGYYSFQPVSVFLGPDARPRISKKAYDELLVSENRTGALLVPDDFSGPKANFMSAWCSAVEPGKTIRATLRGSGFASLNSPAVPVRLQLMAAAPQSPDGFLETTSGWMEFVVTVGSHAERMRHFFTFFRQAEKLFDICLNIPSEALDKSSIPVSISNEDEARTLMLHRIFVNEPPATHRNEIYRLPPLPAVPCFWIGYDLNTATTQNGEVDSLIRRMHDEEMGNYVLFRIEETNQADAGDIERWGKMVRQFNFKAGTTMGGEVSKVLSETVGRDFLGIHQHESSNLIYGWGDSEPREARINRTLPECEAAYTNRMKKIKMLGQALPMCNLDYKSGVDFISSEFPTGHSTLMMASNRGGSYLYDKPFWGVHLANHVMRMPDDESTLRRNFLLIWQSWLYGARLIYDEESAVYGIHSTSYSYSDRMSFIRRQQMQELYHYGSSIDLGAEVVKTGFLLGKYDCLVGGVQSSPEMDPTKVWGMFGPETDPWQFDTPERGWELLNSYMPGVWLYPVPQDNSKIRMFFTSSPNGQADLVTIDGDLDKLKKYELLILPGWNTMTRENYDKLIRYAEGGGHLVISATQQTNHITRNFLTEKKDFNFYNQGDLTGLSGIKAGQVSLPLQSIHWNNGKSSPALNLQGLTAELMPGTTILAKSESGSPVLVEKKIGKGRVWTLIAGDFWGAPGLDRFREQLGDTLAKMHRGDLYLTGDSKEIDYHVYKLKDGAVRVVFMNTDWTCNADTCDVILHTGVQEIPVTITPGKLTSLIMDKKLNIIHQIPGSLVRLMDSPANLHILGLSGAGKQQFILNTGFPPEMTGPDDQSISLQGNILTIDFGNRWVEKIVQLRFLN